MKKFLAVNFGCRVNSAEINQLSQSYINQGYVPDKNNPDIILVNTCAVTKKGEYESLSKIRKLLIDFPQSQIIATGCADLSKLPISPNLQIIYKNNLPPLYTHQIKDKFSRTHRYLLKVQSGCTSNCTYCIVPLRRPFLWSLPISQAIDIVSSAIKDGYREIIITGVNLNQYEPGFANLLEALLTQTNISLISFGSTPLNCIDHKFLSLLQIADYRLRITNLLHIPIQSGSDRILKAMHRPYTRQQILKTFYNLKKLVPPLSSKRGVGGDFIFATDIIVGFPTETDSDFQQTYDLCRQIGFSKIHVFRYSPRPGTPARQLFLNSPKLSKSTIASRAARLRRLAPSA